METFPQIHCKHYDFMVDYGRYKSLQIKENWTGMEQYKQEFIEFLMLNLSEF